MARTKKEVELATHGISASHSPSISHKESDVGTGPSTASAQNPAGAQEDTVHHTTLQQAEKTPNTQQIRVDTRKRKRESTMPSSVSEVNPVPEAKSLVDSAAIRKLGTTLSGRLCHSCSKPLIRSLELHEHIVKAQCFGVSSSNQSTEPTALCLVECSASGCQAVTCLGCGRAPRSMGNKEKRSKVSSNAMPSTCGCEESRIIAVWMILNLLDASKALPRSDFHEEREREKATPRKHYTRSQAKTTDKEKGNKMTDVKKENKMMKSQQDKKTLDQKLQLDSLVSVSMSGASYPLKISQDEQDKYKSYPGSPAFKHVFEPVSAYNSSPLAKSKGSYLGPSKYNSSEYQEQLVTSSAQTPAWHKPSIGADASHTKMPPHIHNILNNSDHDMYKSKPGTKPTPYPSHGSKSFPTMIQGPSKLGHGPQTYAGHGVPVYASPYAWTDSEAAPPASGWANVASEIPKAKKSGSAFGAGVGYADKEYVDMYDDPEEMEALLKQSEDMLSKAKHLKLVEAQMQSGSGTAIGSHKKALAGSESPTEAELAFGLTSSPKKNKHFLDDFDADEWFSDQTTAMPAHTSSATAWLANRRAKRNEAELISKRHADLAAQREAAVQLLTELIRNADLQAPEISTPAHEFSSLLPQLLRASAIRTIMADVLLDESLDFDFDQKGLRSAVLMCMELWAEQPSLQLLCTEPRSVTNVSLHDLTFDSQVDQSTIFHQDPHSSLLGCMTNLASGCHTTLQAAETNAAAYRRSKTLLDFCTRVQALSTKLKDLLPQSQPISRILSPWLQYCEDNRVTYIEDDEMFNGFHYAKDATKMKTSGGSRFKRLVDDISILKTSLPDGIFVKIAYSRLDMMKVLVLGPRGTPYESGLFEFHLLCPPQYPRVPPQVWFPMAAETSLRLNPNLHAYGMVCLSLLGTWGGHANETWQPGKSTILQVLVSIQSMVFCAEPYYNEPGYGTHEDTTNSDKYSLAVQALTVRLGMLYWLRDKKWKQSIWKEVIEAHMSSTEHSPPAALTTVNQWAKTNKHLKRYIGFREPMHVLGPHAETLFASPSPPITPSLPVLAGPVTTADSGLASAPHPAPSSGHHMPKDVATSEVHPFPNMHAPSFTTNVVPHTITHVTVSTAENSNGPSTPLSPRRHHVYQARNLFQELVTAVAEYVKVIGLKGAGESRVAAE